MSAEVAVYVQSRYAKPADTVESYNVRAWPGAEMVCHARRHAGIEVDYCSSATVGRCRIVRGPVTSGCGWYPFVGERLCLAKSPFPEGRGSSKRKHSDFKHFGAKWRRLSRGVDCRRRDSNPHGG